MQAPILMKNWRPCDRPTSMLAASVRSQSVAVAAAKRRLAAWCYRELSVCQCVPVCVRQADRGLHGAMCVQCVQWSYTPRTRAYTQALIAAITAVIVVNLSTKRLALSDDTDANCRVFPRETRAVDVVESSLCRRSSADLTATSVWLDSSARWLHFHSMASWSFGELTCRRVDLLPD